ncbi:glycosyltransferase family 4 protein [Belliella kenyensis]|uniref:Glycosyltransferase family 4 protein n=1 Tax=Belliella kenyensis TaxID=1472724 RepID=A0ABV8EIB3_9BACT|nr:glycosyltransferase family 4 protein [Belliella kenyensis]MCH7403433.1 glycosyltransferase family 4 protein [Belliella kenyensis]MDN3602333.1 glycosyltransferase family 4 protein [Belliella kenyensis]
MKKIAFIVCQYGKEVNGGAEIHCKMLAERLTPFYDVEVLTSTTIDINTFEPFYEEGLEIMNEVKVRRFQTQPFEKSKYEKIYKASKLGRKIRRNLFRIKALKWISNLFPVWSIGTGKEEEMLKAHGLFSPSLIEYVNQNVNSYQAIILISYPYPSTYFIGKKYPNNCILIPTAHEEGDLYRSIQSKIFTEIFHIAFNTEAERDLCKKVFGNKLSKSSILAVGIDITEPTSEDHIVEKFDLPDSYILYFGRITPVKIGKLTDWFLEYKKINKSNVKLVLTGRLFMKMVNNEDIIYTGFVSEAEKTALISKARMVVNPSDKESLSLLLLESMALGKPVIVNGNCEVMKQHCIKSDFACDYFITKNDFFNKLELSLENSKYRDNMVKKAKEYVLTHYNWKKIISDLKILIEEVPVK